MSFWANQFVAVCYWAKQFKLAKDQLQNHCLCPQLRTVQAAHLSYARMNLECAVAMYQLCRQQKELK